jgi:hypothetical protein
MSYASNLTTLRSLGSNLRVLEKVLESPTLSLEDYLSLCSLLEKVSALRDSLDKKVLVLDYVEDEEGICEKCILSVAPATLPETVPEYCNRVLKSDPFRAIRVLYDTRNGL